MPTRLLGKIITFLFPADLDENDILTSSCSEDELKEDLDNAVCKRSFLKECCTLIG